MNQIINKGKSLIFLKMCEDYGIDFKIQRTSNYEKHYILTSKIKSSCCYTLNIANEPDIYGTLIDFLIELKYTEGNEELFKTKENV